MKIRGKDIIKKGTYVESTWARIDKLIEHLGGMEAFMETYLAAEDDATVNKTLDLIEEDFPVD